MWRSTGARKGCSTYSRDMRSRLFQVFLQPREVLLHTQQVRIRAVRNRIVEEGVETIKILVDARPRVIRPEGWSSAHDIFRGFVLRETNAVFFVGAGGLCELGKQHRQFLDVIARGHLPEQIRCAERVAEQTVDLVAKRKRLDVCGDARATNHVRNGVEV